MTAPKGNRFWLARSRHGVKPTFPPTVEGHQKLVESCIDYFEWCEDNPLYEARLVSYEGVSTIEELPKIRAMTVEGLCLFIDITSLTWREWKSSRQDLTSIQAWAEGTIRQQKFSGAAAGLLNAAIIARDLGLADRTEVSGPGGGPVMNVNTEMTAQEAAEAYARTRDGR